MPSTRLPHPVQPALDLGRDLLPAVGDHHQMGPPGELEVIRMRRRLLVLLVLLVRERRRNGVVLVGPDDQQRRALAVPEMDLGRRVQVEVGKTRLVEDLAGLGDGVLLVGGLRVLGRERVDETVRELLERQVDDAVPRRWVRERRGRGLQGRERKHEDPLGRRRTHRHSRAAETAVEQQLDEQPAVGVTHQERGLGQRADQ